LTYLAWLRFSATPAEDLTAAEDAIAQVLADMPDHPMARFVKGDILKAKHEFGLLPVSWTPRLGVS
jgi:hypothetical protein